MNERCERYSLRHCRGGGSSTCLVLTSQFRLSCSARRVCCLLIGYTLAPRFLVAFPLLSLAPLFSSFPLRLLSLCACACLSGGRSPQGQCCLGCRAATR